MSVTDHKGTSATELLQDGDDRGRLEADITLGGARDRAAGCWSRGAFQIASISM